MRYEDASNSFQGSGPQANDDSDQLPAGAKEAATGNLITGEGTQYGASGADSAAGGHITSIAGKGGEDSSFAGGKLSVAGEYGKLTVDAEGNYNYKANNNAPENVRDRFTYTLADNQGGTDTAALVIELGKTPVVIKADAQQIVPGPDGVVTLPPGVELSDVMVVGRNLVINMPDGTQLIIVDGAVFVPQLVLDGVQVPATNVAALLIGQEPQPAAGELPPSSGGNFALPPPPLDPGVPLGDLIPPTVRDYIPPEPQEVFPIESRPLINFGNIDILIDDDTLPGGRPGGQGDGPDAVNVTGFLSQIPDLGGNPPYTFSLALTSAPDGFALVSGGPGVALLQQNGVTVRTISYNPTTGQYEVTQNAHIQHPAGGEENNLNFVFTVTVTDATGQTASGTITLTYNDDTPGATDAQVGGTVDEDGVPGGIPGGTDDVLGENTVVNGSVVSLFEAGADGPLTYGLSGNTSGLPSLTSHGVAVTYAVAGNTLTASAGGSPVFTLTVNADGSYTFTLLGAIDHPTLNGQAGDNTENDLSLALGSIVQATDSDGDPVTAPANGLVIVVDDDMPVIGRTEGQAPTLVVDETNLAQNASGDFSVLFDGDVGADAPGSTSYAVSVVNGTDSGLVDVATGQSIFLFNNNGVVEGRVGGSGGAVAFTVSVNANTGVVTLDQVRALEHPLNPNQDEPISPDPTSIQLTANLTDADGDSASLTVNIGGNLVFEDDGPSVNPVLDADATVTVDESLPSGTPGIDTGAIVKGDDPHLDGGLAIGQANSGTAIVDANAVFGADGAAASNSLTYALSITNTNPGVTLTDGTTITMQMVGGVIVGVVDAGPFAGQAAFAIAINPATGVVTVEQYLSLDHPVNPDPNDPLGLGDNTVAVTVTATDGDGDSVTSDGVDISGQITFLDDGPTINPALNADAEVTVDESLPSGAPTIDTGAIAKGDDPDLAGGLALGFGTSGEAVVDAAAVFGADGPQGEGGLTYALSILGVNSDVTLTDGTAINLQLVGGVIVGVVAAGAFAGQAAFAIAIDPNSGVVTVEQYLSLDHPVNPDPNDPLGLGDNTVGVTVTGTDGDGDPVTSDAVDISSLITFLDDGPDADPVLDQEAVVEVDESLPSNTPGIDTLGVTKGDDPDLAGGLAIGQGNSGTAIIDVNAVFGADGPAAGGGISYALSILNANSGLTLTDGTAINLQLLANGVVVGVVAAGTFAGQAAFAIAIDPTSGVVTVEQYLSLDHPINPDPNDPLGLGENTLGVTATVTDGDGDSITTDAIDISSNITFRDDGPDAAVNTDAPLDTLVLDETRPVGTEEDGNSSPAGLMTVQANFADNFVAPINYGADGPGSVAYSFVLSGSNVNSGLYAIDPNDLTAGDGDGIGRGTQIVLNLSGNTITGSANGTDYFTITINPNTGVVTFTQLDNIWHGNTASDDDMSALMASVGSLLVRQTVTDGDGDTDTADVDVSQGVFQIEDDGPVARNDVDEILSGGDTAVGNVITGVGTNGGAANADDVGEDLPGRVSAVVSVNEPGNTDQDPSANVFEIDGEFGTLVLNSNGSYTYTRFDGAPGNSQDVFTYTLIDADGDTETATLTINIGDAAPNLPDPALIRLDDDVIPGAGGNPDGVGDDDPDTVGQNVANGTLVGTGGDGTLTYNFTGLNTLPATFTIGAGSDSDTLLINQNGSLVMTIQLNQATGAFTVTQNAPIDHLAGNNENNYEFSIGVEVEDADGDVEPATITINVDDDTPVASVNGQAALDQLVLDETRPEGTDTAGGGAPTGDASVTANFADNFTAPVAYGADGPGSTSYKLVLSANGIASGMFALDAADTTAGDGDGIGRGAPITLSISPDGLTITGSANGTDYFTIVINATTGDVTFTQLNPIWHPTPGSSYDEAAALNTAAAANVQVQQTVTDGDGDSASATLNIGQGVFSIQDDGPDAAVNGTAPLDTIVLDESRPEGTDTPGGGAPTGDASSTANFADNFAAVTDFGADGAGSVVYSLSLSANGIGSGLFALDSTDVSTGDGDGYGQGSQITLSLAGGVITGSANGTDYFTISINSSTGVVTFTQLNPIWHPTAPANFDETATLTTAAAANVQVVQTVTDADGDTDSASINVGQGVFSIQDDGPQAIQPDPASLENEAGATVTVDLDDDGEVITDFGEDGAGKVRFANIANGDDSGLTSSDDPIEYWLSNDGQTLQARTNSTNGTDGQLIFTVQINQASGDYTVTMTGTVDNGAGITFDNLTSSKAGNVDVRAVGADDPTTPVDLLLTASVNGANATINTDSDSIGSANQSMDEGETVRIDFVENAVTNAAKPAGFAYDGHVSSQTYEQTIPQVQGAQNQTVAFRVYALDTTVTDAGSPDDTPVAGLTPFSDSTTVAITHVTIDGYAAGETPVTVAIGAVGVWTTIAYGVSAQLQADGSVIFTGVQEGDRYGIETGSGFNAIAVTSLASGVGPVGGQSTTNSFDLGVLAIGQVQTGDPIDISLDLSITDADGDTVTMPGAIDITLEPATDSLAATFSSFASQEEQLQKIAANSNTLTLATAVAAAGFVEPVAAHDNGNHEGRGHGVEAATFAAPESVETYSVDDGGDAAVSMLAPEVSKVSAPADTSNGSSSDNASSSNSLDNSAAHAAPESNDAPAADDGGSHVAAATVVPVAPEVAMVSAEALEAAAKDGGNAQQGGSVEQIVADAMQDSGADVDAALANLPGGNGALQALAHMASPAEAAVSGWHMAGHGASSAAHDMIMKMDVSANHHDAVQPVANG